MNDFNDFLSLFRISIICNYICLSCSMLWNNNVENVELFYMWLSTLHSPNPFITPSYQLLKGFPQQKLIRRLGSGRHLLFTEFVTFQWISNFDFVNALLNWNWPAAKKLHNTIILRYSIHDMLLYAFPLNEFQHFLGNTASILSR